MSSDFGLARVGGEETGIGPCHGIHLWDMGIYCLLLFNTSIQGTVIRINNLDPILENVNSRTRRNNLTPSL
jgi:hypothetical protein